MAVYKVLIYQGTADLNGCLNSLVSDGSTVLGELFRLRKKGMLNELEVLYELIQMHAVCSSQRGKWILWNLPVSPRGRKVEPKGGDSFPGRGGNFVWTQKGVLLLQLKLN